MHSIKVKVLLLVIGIILASNAGLSIVSYSSFSKTLHKTVEQTLNITADEIAEKINDENNKNLAVVRALANLDLIKSRDLSIEEKNAILKGAGGTSDGIGNLSYFDKEGNCIIDGHMYNFTSDELYIREGLAGREYVSPPRFMGTGVTFMSIEVPVTDENGRNNGLLCMIVDGSRMTEFAKTLTVGYNSHPIVIDTASKVLVADADEERLLRSMNGESVIPTQGEIGQIYSNFVAGKSDFAVFTDPSTGSRYVGYYRPVGESCTWAVFCSAPYGDYFQPLESVKSNIVIVVIITMIVAIIISIALTTLFVKPLNVIRDDITGISQGNADLRKRIEMSEKGEIGGVVKGFNLFAAKLQNIIKEVKESKDVLSTAGEDLEASTQDTGTSISEIITNINNVHSQINAQSESVTETAGAVNQIASNIESLERMIENQSAGVAQASSAVEEMIGNIKSVNDSVDKMAISFADLTEDANNGSRLQLDVNDKIETIKNQSEALQEANAAIAAIAEQTNLLAMNAAIEAAHAGEAGKGFSVVADEIRKLSETSGEQSRSIGEELNRIGESINLVVNASEQSSTAFQNVTNKIKETDEVVRMIKAAMEEQNQGSRQISEALRDMNDSTIEVRTASKEMSEGNKQILAEINKLQNATNAMQGSMEEMTYGARKINETGTALTEIADKLKNSINKIGSQIDLFQV